MRILGESNVSQKGKDFDFIFRDLILNFVKHLVAVWVILMCHVRTDCGIDFWFYKFRILEPFEPPNIHS